jgi:hypothetical protein
MVLLVLLGHQARADEGSRVDPDADRLQFCRTLREGRDQIKGMNRFTVVRDFLKLAIAPGSLVKLKLKEVPVSDSLRVVPGDRSGALPKNIIFSIDPPAEWVQSADIPQLRKSFEALNTEIYKYTSFVTSLIFSPSPEVCATRIKSTGFDPEYFSGLLKKRSEYRLLNQIDEAGFAHRAIQKMLAHAQLPWTLIQTTDLDEVHQALRNPEVENVVIFTHGLSGGKLIDSRFNSYPLGFFNDFSSHLRTLTVFACHGEETATLYSLEKAMKEQPSIHPDRAIFLSIGSTLGGRDELVPLTAFRKFMHRVERRIIGLQWAELRSSVVGTPGNPPGNLAPLCSVELSDFKVKSGTYGLILNGQFLGSIHGEPSHRVMDYPCRFMNREKNILVIQSLGVSDPAQIQSENFEIMTRYPGRTVVGIHDLRFHRTDGSYQGSRIEFSVSD